MKINKANIIPYSSVVGGGLVLLDDGGQALFYVSFRGTTKGISKVQTEELSAQFQRFVEEHGLDVTVK